MLEVVRRAHVELAESPIHAGRLLDLEIAEHRDPGTALLGREEHGIGIDVRAQERVRARLDEPRLVQLGARLLLREQVPRRVDRRLHPQRIEDDPRLDLEMEVSKVTEEVMALPPQDRVKVGLDGIELDPAAERELVELARLEPHDERHDGVGGGRLRELGNDRHVPEDAEVEDGLLRRVDLGRRVGLAGIDVERAADGLLRESPESLDRRAAKLGRGPGHDLVGDAGVVAREIDLGSTRRARVGIPVIGEGAFDVLFGRGVVVVVEANPFS